MAVKLTVHDCELFRSSKRNKQTKKDAKMAACYCQVQVCCAASWSLKELCNLSQVHGYTTRRKINENEKLRSSFVTFQDLF